MAIIRYKEALGIEVGRGRPALGKKPDKKNLKMAGNRGRATASKIKSTIYPKYYP